MKEKEEQKKKKKKGKRRNSTKTKGVCMRACICTLTQTHKLLLCTHYFSFASVTWTHYVIGFAQESAEQKDRKGSGCSGASGATTRSATGK